MRTRETTSSSLNSACTIFSVSDNQFVFFFCIAIEKIKHYVLLATGGKYRFIGNNQPEFDKLTDLLKYYK